MGENLPKHVAKYEQSFGDLKTIPYLTSDTSTFTTAEEMLPHARQFWATLFHSPEFGPYKPPCATAMRGLLQRYTDSSPLPVKLYDSLEAPITYEELSDIITKLPKFRSNGPDGLPYEFYANPLVWKAIGVQFH